MTTRNTEPDSMTSGLTTTSSDSKKVQLLLEVELVPCDPRKQLPPLPPWQVRVQQLALPQSELLALFSVLEPKEGSTFSPTMQTSSSVPKNSSSNATPGKRSGLQPSRQGSIIPRSSDLRQDSLAVHMVGVSCLLCEHQPALPSGKVRITGNHLQFHVFQTDPRLMEELIDDPNHVAIVYKEQVISRPEDARGRLTNQVVAILELAWTAFRHKAIVALAEEQD